MNIPKNISEFLNVHDESKLSINLNSAKYFLKYDGHILLCSFHLSIITRTCNRCGHDLLWHPERDECNQHTYGNFRYDDVFIWKAIVKDDRIDTSSLETAFDIWLKANPAPYIQPAKYMAFEEDKEL